MLSTLLVTSALAGATLGDPFLPDPDAHPCAEHYEGEEDCSFQDLLEYCLEVVPEELEEESSHPQNGQWVIHTWTVMNGIECVQEGMGW